MIQSITCVLSLLQLHHSLPSVTDSLPLLLNLAFVSIAPFDDEKLIAAPGHETRRGRETESHVEWDEMIARGGEGDTEKDGG